MKLVWQIAAALGAVLQPFVPVAAQGEFSFRPSFGVAEVYDDNIFSEPGARERDLITRVSPGLECAFLSKPLSFSARYDFDAEVFSEHPELTSYQARRTAGVEARYRRGPRLELVARGGYADTRTPGELNTGTGLQVARVRGERIVVGAGAAYRLGPLDSLTVDYTFTDEGLSGGMRSQLQTQSLGIERRLDSRSSVTLQGLVRLFAFDGGPTETVPVVTAGWSHQLTPLLLVSIRGGPRFSETPGAEVSADLRLRLRRSEVSVNYVRTQATAIGLSGHFDTESASAALSLGRGSDFELRAGPSVLRTRGTGFEATVYRVSLELLAPIFSWLTLDASADLGVQRGGVAAVGEIWHDVVMVRFIARKPPRERPGARAEVF